jgi:hypothetical protein
MSKVFNFLSAFLFASGLLKAENDTLRTLFLLPKANPFVALHNTAVISVYGSLYLDANAASNDLLFVNVYKGEFKTQVLERNFEKQWKNNLAGTDNRGSFSFLNLKNGVLGKDNIHWFAEYGFRDFASYKFSGDLFKLLFLGNNKAQDETLDGSGLKALRYKYDYVRGGMLFNLAKGSYLKFGLGVSRSIQFESVSAERLRVYTAPYGMYLDLDANVDATTGKSDSYSLMNREAYGAIGMLQYGFSKAKWDYAFTLDHFGISYFSQSKRYQKDTAFTYRGVEIDPTNPINETVVTNAFDSIAQMFAITESRPDIWRALPATISASAAYHLDEKTMLIGRLDAVVFGNFIPMLSLSYVKGNKKWHYNSTLSLGGFGVFNLSQDFGFSFKQHQIGVGIIGIEGLLLPKTFGGLGGHLQYVYLFR